MVIEIKNSHVVFIGLVLTFLLALLPGSILLRAAIAVPIIGTLILLVRGGSWATRSKANAIASAVLILVLVAIGPGVLVIGGLFYLLVVWIAVFLLPTAINLGMSYLAIQALPNRLWLTIPAFLIVSLSLAFNVRIPGMLTDWFNVDQPSSVTKVVQLTQDEPILLVSNVEQISFRGSPHEPIGFGGNEGCGCVYWIYPRTITEDVEDALQRAGIRYTKSGNARHRLVIDSHEEDGVTHFAISLWDGPDKTASQKGKRRAYYPYEEDFGKVRRPGVDYLPYRLLFLAQNSFWNHALSFVTSLKTAFPIGTFLENAVRISSPHGQRIADIQPTKVRGEVESLTTFQPFIGKQDYRETIGPLAVECKDRIETGLRYDSGSHGSIGLTGSTVTFKEGSESFTIVTRDLERVICTNDVVYVIGALANQEVRIQKFSPRGNLLADHVVALPKMSFEGFPRKRVIDFLDTEGGYEFTLLDIAEEGYYYGVKGAYRIRARHNSQQVQPTPGS